MKKLFVGLISISLFYSLGFAQKDFVGTVSIDNGAKQSIQIRTDSNETFVYQLPKKFKGNKIVLEFDNIDLKRDAFNRGENIAINNPSKVVFFIEQNKIKSRIDEYIVIGDDGKTLGRYFAKQSNTRVITIRPTSFYSQYNKNKFDAEEKVRLVKAEQEQRELNRINDLKNWVYKNPLYPQIGYKNFTPKEIYDAFSSAVGDPVQSVVNIRDWANGKPVYFEAIQIFQKKRR